MSRIDSTPNSDLVSTPAPEETRMAKKIARGRKIAEDWTTQATGFAKKRPYFVGAIALAAAGLLAYKTVGGGGNKFVPVAEAGLPPTTASKVQETSQTKDVEIVVGSYKKVGTSLLILNNHQNYKEATMSIVVDLRSCPDIGAIHPRTLKGQTIRAHGQFQTYDGRPQVKVTRSQDLEVNPAPSKG